MMSVCSATKRDGTPCTLPANGPQGLCWAHDPQNAERRRRGASRGGRAKANRELPDIKRRLSEMAEGVMEGKLNRSNAAVAAQIYNVYFRAVGVELKIREQQELAERLEALEDALEQHPEHRRGGFGNGA